MFQTLGLQELYLGCFGIGFLMVAGSFLLTGGRHKVGNHRGPRLTHMRSGHGAGHSHTGANSARGARVAGSSGNGVRHGASTRAGHVRAGGHAKTGSGSHGQARGVTAKATSGRGADISGVAQKAGSELFINASREVETESNFTEQLYFSAMGVLNPMALALFIFFFGASGLIVTRYSPGLGATSGIPAGVAGLLMTMVIQNCLGWFASKLENSVVNLLDDAIGLVGEITVSIATGRTGEVMFVLNQGRRNYAAKALDPAAEIKRGAKVLIVDREEDLMFVQPFDELDIDESDR